MEITARHVSGRRGPRGGERHRPSGARAPGATRFSVGGRGPRWATTAAGALLLVAAATPAVAQPNYSSRPFSSVSPFNTRLAAGPGVAPGGLTVGNTARSVNYSEYTPVVHVGRSGDPLYTIRLRNQGAWGSNPLHGRVVPIPRNARSHYDDDGHLTIVVPSQDLVISLFQADTAPSGTTWWATWGGMAKLSGNGANQLNSSGGRESGISQLAGLITPDDVRRGIAAGENGDLGHALAIGYPTVHRTRFVSPAIKAGGLSTSTSALVMGQRVYLDPTVNVNTINFTIPYVSSAASERFSRLVARTLQRYGAIVVTNSPRLSFQLVHPKSYTSVGLVDPWPGLIGRAQSGYYAYTVRPIPASMWRVLPTG